MEMHTLVAWYYVHMYTIRIDLKCQPCLTKDCSNLLTSTTVHVHT